jgi:four helix bundle protein
MKMKKKTFNIQRSTFNIEWIGVREDEERYGAKHGEAAYGARKETLNAQRSTPNAQRQRQTRFDLEDRLLEFSARVVRLVDELPNTRAANHLAGQLLRSGTSPYGNHGEVEAAESRKDFIHKLKICLKELKETRRWLRLAAKSAMVPVARMTAILAETEELIRIFFSSIRTTERNAK